MSLDFHYGNVANKDQVIWDENDRMRPEVESIIFNTMTIGINHIKDEETAVKFYRRYTMYYQSKGWDRFYDLAFVKSMIGLSTNASPITDAAFKSTLYKNLEESANLVVNKEVREGE